MNVFDGKKILATCESPFQLFGLVAMCSADYFSRCSDLHIVVSSQVRRMGSQMGLLMKALRGAHVILLEEEYVESKHLGLESILWRFFPSAKLKNRRSKLRNRVGADDFDVLLFASATPLVLDARSMVRSEGYSVLYDDGSGTHNGAVAASLAFYDELLADSAFRNLGRSDRAKWYFKRLVNNVTGGRLSFGVIEVLMFNPTKEEKGLYIGVETEEMPVGWMKPFRGRQGEIDGSLLEDPSLDGRIVLLSLPDDVAQSEIAVEEDAAEVLEDCFGSCSVIRPHPRSCRYRDNSLSDKGRDLWEMRCLMGSVTPDTTLIGFGSSARYRSEANFRY